MFGGFPFEEMFGGGGMPGGGRGRHGPPSDDEEDLDTEAHYKTLGVDQNASDADIKKAYKKLSRKWHPDRKGGNEAKFQELQAAHEVLSDPHKRDLYNRGGMKAVKQGGVGPTSIFDMFNGGGRRGGGQRQRRQEKASEISKRIDITLEDVYKGPTIEVPYKYLKASGRSVCQKCDGQGRVMEVIRQGFMQIQTQRACSACDGKGIGFASEETIDAVARVPVPQGVRHGDKILLRNEGHDIPGAERGDVKITVVVRKHKLYERVGADLAVKKTLTLREALCGHTFKLTHVSGNVLVVNCKPGEVTPPASIKKVAEWGLPQKGGHFSKGHLYIKYDLVFPVPGSVPAADIATLDAVLARCTYPEIKVKAPEIEEGAHVKIVNLGNYPQFNNKMGIVMGQTRNSRWAVELKSGKQLSVPVEKLQLIVDDEPLHRKNKRQRPSNEEEEEEETYEEEVMAELIEGEPDTTPAISAASAYDEEEQDHERVSECRAM